MFDDGASTSGRGDALLYDQSSATLRLVECKVRGKKNAEQQVIQQACKYAHRLVSWLTHISNVDSNTLEVKCVEVWVVFGKGKKIMELPGIEPTRQVPTTMHYCSKKDLHLENFI